MTMRKNKSQKRGKYFVCPGGLYKVILVVLAMAESSETSKIIQILKNRENDNLTEVS